MAHKEIYEIGIKLPKHHKLGMHATVEKLCLDSLALTLESAFRPPIAKKVTLEMLRIKISVLKNILRTEYELGIINEKIYLRISEQLVEISKMTNGWIKSLTHKGP